MPSGDDKGDEDDDAHRRNLAAILIGGAIVAALGIWLAHAFYSYLSLERCQEERHRFCTDSVEVPR
ncbi:MAG: hypothetical protein ACREHE_10475 [Rhizomicrobium sp.]